MSNPNKAKGSRWEVRVRDYLQENGAPHCERLASSGSNDRGDLTGTPGVVWECKNHARIELASWLDELAVEMHNANAKVGAVIHPRRGKNISRAYVTLDLAMYCALLRDAGFLVPLD